MQPGCAPIGLMEDTFIVSLSYFNTSLLRNFSKSWGISSRLSPRGIQIALEKPR